MEKPPEIFDVAIIGAGPAGLFTAIKASEKAKVAVFDSFSGGKKLLLTGGKRCNFTHYGNPDDIAWAYRNKTNFIKPALKEFPPHKIIEFFSDLGIEHKIEKNNCVYPLGKSAKDILNALVSKCISNGVHFFNNSLVSDIIKEKDLFYIFSKRINNKAKKVIIATGGLSYPNTGSTGIGYAIAKRFKHNIIDFSPGLVGLFIQEKFIKRLSGTSIKNVKLFAANDKFSFGDLLFTEFGISGPAVFDISSEISPNFNQKIMIDFLPDHDDVFLDKFLINLFNNHPHKNIISLCEDLTSILKDKIIPKSFLEALIKENKIDFNTKYKDVDRIIRKKIIYHFKNLTLSIEKSQPIEKAIVTIGGIDTNEINRNTMESKIVPGLFFAGEIIDVDGKCGGYNLQMCWSTGYLAGKNASKFND